MTTHCTCGGGAPERFPVLHHMPCAYVGPVYDYAPAPGGINCPKCSIAFRQSAPECEILGYALRCPACGAEWPEEASA